VFLPAGPPRAAVLVLHGSSGIRPVHRERVLADRGYAVLAPQWFGAPGLPPGISEVPLEGFDVHLDQLAELSLPLVVMGTSKGAEAALLLATQRQDIDVVVALAPTAVVWEGLTAGDESAGCSSWTRRARPLPYVPHLDAGDWRSFATACAAHEASLRQHAASLAAASIRAEDIRADVVLAAGGDDPVWPSADAAERLSRRREAAGLETTVLVHPQAGHRVLLPEEPFLAADPSWPMGGTEVADRELGAAVLEALDRMLPAS
jgi:dienelactone hydrolase